MGKGKRSTKQQRCSTFRTVLLPLSMQRPQLYTGEEERGANILNG